MCVYTMSNVVSHQCPGRFVVLAVHSYKYLIHSDVRLNFGIRIVKSIFGIYLLEMYS